MSEDGPVFLAFTGCVEEGKVVVLLTMPEGYEVTQVKTYRDAAIQDEEGDVIFDPKHNGGQILRISLDDERNRIAPEIRLI